MRRNKRFWLVEGYDPFGSVIHRRAYPMYLYSELQMRDLLQTLAGKSALTFDEIAGALCRKGQRTALLEVQRLNGLDPGGVFTLACGPSLDWTALLLPEGDRRLDGLL